MLRFYEWHCFNTCMEVRNLKKLQYCKKNEKKTNIEHEPPGNVGIFMPVDK